MGISVLLLLVNLPQADANLCGDEVTVKINDITDTTIFMSSGIVPYDDIFFITPEVFIGFNVMCDGLIFWDYNNNDINNAQQDIGDQQVPGHSFWFTDLMWTDPSGQVGDFFVTGFCDTNIMATGSTTTIAHATVDPFTIPAGSDLLCNLQLVSMHNAIGGEISPITTSALLLAGAQNSMAWMIPLVVAAAGFGLVISRKL